MGGLGWCAPAVPQQHQEGTKRRRADNKYDLPWVEVNRMGASWERRRTNRSTMGAWWGSTIYTWGSPLSLGALLESCLTQPPHGEHRICRCPDADVAPRHVLEGLTLEELETLNASGYLPDKFNAWKSCAASWWRLDWAFQLLDQTELKSNQVLYANGFKLRNLGGLSLRDVPQANFATDHFHVYIFFV